MKKLLPIISAIGLLFLMSGCSPDGSSKDDEPEAPEVSSASELPASGGTAPTSQAEALTIFSGAFNGFSEALDSQTGAAYRRNARATESGSEDISWTGPAGGGTVDITGSYDYDIDYPDSYPNTGWYRITGDVSMDMNGTVSGVTVTGDDGYDYTISGDIVENYDSDFEYGIYFANGSMTDFSYELDFSLEFGLALSVRRDDGVGAKFVITFAGEASGEDMSELESVSGTLRVYDDANTLLYETAVSPDDLDGLELFGGVF